MITFINKLLWKDNKIRTKLTKTLHRLTINQIKTKSQLISTSKICKRLLRLSSLPIITEILQWAQITLKAILKAKMIKLVTICPINWKNLRNGTSTNNLSNLRNFISTMSKYWSSLRMKKMSLFKQNITNFLTWTWKKSIWHALKERMSCLSTETL